MTVKTTTTTLTVAQVAEQLKMTPDGVYKLIRRGKLPAQRVSARNTLVRADDLAEYVASLNARAGQLRSGSGEGVDLEREFEAAHGMAPEAFVAAFKAGHVEDSSLAMASLARAAALVAGRAAQTVRTAA
jgi:excisionase family DNA binding protein